MSITNVVLLGFSTGSGGHLIPTIGFGSGEAVTDEPDEVGGSYPRNQTGRGIRRTEVGRGFRRDQAGRGWRRRDE